MNTDSKKIINKDAPPYKWEYVSKSVDSGNWHHSRDNIDWNYSKRDLYSGLYWPILIIVPTALVIAAFFLLKWFILL